VGLPLYPEESSVLIGAITAQGAEVDPAALYYDAQAADGQYRSPDRRDGARPHRRHR